MPLSIGTRLGPYEVIAPLGAGGMGEVYLARDMRLNRQVAIKALPALFATDKERVARFEREAQLLAALNHPNLAGIYGVEEHAGSIFLILELVAGESLAARLTASPIPQGEAIDIARQIASALEAAHEKGIIHRDLKPANVMLTPEGQVKVLDFGLAKAIVPEAVSDAENSPTLTGLAATQAGMILGTAAYMSPEQAKGRPADKRSDVWAFGCVLFELLSGTRAFRGEDVSDTLAEVLRGEPDWTALPSTVPPAVRTLLQRALVKNRAQRISDISTACFLLAESSITALGSAAGANTTSATNIGESTMEGSPGRARKSVRLSHAAAAVLVAALVAAAVMWLVARRTTPSDTPAVTRLTATLPPGDRLGPLGLPSLAISPDGTQIVYAAVHADQLRLLLRRLDSTESVPITGTEGGTMPFFSPDGRWIGFFAQNQLKKVSVAGSGLETLCRDTPGAGGSWGEDGTIYFSRRQQSGVWAVSEAGGTPREITRLDVASGEVSHRWPQVLPGGKTLLFTIWTGPGWDEQQVVVQSVATAERRILVRGGATGRYVSAGYLVYVRADEMLALPMDLDRLEVARSAPAVLSEQVRGEADEGAHYAVSNSGALVYLSGGPDRYNRRLVWVDRAGNIETPPQPVRHYSELAISPDGRQAAVQIEDATHSIWIYDFARTTLTPLVVTEGTSQAPTWVLGGKGIAYRGTRAGFRNLFWKAVDGTSPEQRLATKAGETQTPTSWSETAHTLAFTEAPQTTRADIWILNLDGRSQAEAFLATPEGESDPQFSPDGRFLAYHSNASGQPEIYVKPFPGPGAARMVSTGGGVESVWSPAGGELFYLSGDAMMAVDVATTPALKVGVPRTLFRGSFKTTSTGPSSYGVSADGKRFLRIQPVQPQGPVTEIRVVLNWFQELTRAAVAK